MVYINMPIVFRFIANKMTVIKAFKVYGLQQANMTNHEQQR